MGYLRRPTVHSLLVVLLVVLAGCSGSVMPSPENPQAAIENSSSDSANASNPAAANATLPPGVSAEGIENLSALAQANRQKLIREGYVSAVLMRGTMTTENRTRNISMVQREIVRAGAKQFLFQVKRASDRQQSRMDMWSNGSRTYLRSDRRGKISYREVNPDAVRKNLGASGLIAQYAGPGEFKVTNVNKSGSSTRIRLRADEYAERPSKQMPAPENVSEYKAVLIVDSSGRVHYLDVVMDYAGPKGGDASIHLRYKLRQVGQPTLQRPAWIDEAVSETQNSTASGTDGHGHGGGGESGGHH